MRYLIALFVPPLAVLFCRKPLQSLLNLLIWVPGVVLSFVGIGLAILPIPVIHALLVVNSHLADKRNSQLVDAMRSRP